MMPNALLPSLPDRPLMQAPNALAPTKAYNTASDDDAWLAYSLDLDHIRLVRMR